MGEEKGMYMYLAQSWHVTNRTSIKRQISNGRGKGNVHVSCPVLARYEQNIHKRTDQQWERKREYILPSPNTISWTSKIFMKWKRNKDRDTIWRREDGVTQLLCWASLTGPNIPPLSSLQSKQKRSTEGCSKFKSPETRQVHERLVSTLEHMQVPKWDRTRCPEE